jgi:cytochrome c oxidase subunit 2
MLSKSFLFRKQDIYIQIIRSNNLDLFLFLFYLEMVNSFYQLSFQSAVTPLMESIVSLHNHIFFFLLLVFVFVFWIFGNIIYYFYYLPTIDLEYRCSTVFLRYFNHNAYLEIIWTIIPSLILIVIAIPSFALLYSMDEPLQPTLTLKVVGHQWYWSYEYSNWLEENIPLVFDSYMLNEDELNFGEYRLLQVDNPVVLPVETQLRFIITAEDVIHSFAVPQLGVKLDAIPGRLNQQGVYLYRSGVFYGQCSELCGVNHGFMPIVIKGVTFPEFFDWYIVHL